MTVTETCTISEAKLAANRANSEHSTGPITEEGRAAVRMNATRHGITATISLLPAAERAAFDDLCARLKSGYQPVGEVELQYFQNIAEAQWRFNRALAAEDNLIALQIAKAPDHALANGNTQIADALHATQSFVDNSKQHNNLTLYQQRYMRIVEKNIKLLNQAQATRKAAEAKAREEAERLRELSLECGTDYDPIKEAARNGGFVFSTEDLDASNRRRHVLQVANLGRIASWDLARKRLFQAAA